MNCRLDFCLKLFHTQIMIEIAFDENKTSTKKKKSYPLIDVPLLKSADIRAYIDFARQMLEKYKEEQYLIVCENEAFFCIKTLAFAFFIASVLFETKLDCLVLKVKDKTKTYQAYKPLIAASIGIKYALRIADFSPFEIYKELQCLNYLNFDIKEDYANHALIYQTRAEGNKKIMAAHTIFEAILYVTLLKILALAEIDENIELTVYKANEKPYFSKSQLIEAVLTKFSAYQDIFLI